MRKPGFVVLDMEYTYKRNALAFSSCIEAMTALAESRVKDGYEMIVRQLGLIICKTV